MKKYIKAELRIITISNDVLTTSLEVDEDVNDNGFIMKSRRHYDDIYYED